MLELLEERNRRMRSGLYRDSISLAISICTLPFAEQLIGENNEPGSLWKFDSNLQDRLWDLAHAVLAPATLTRRAVGATVRTLLLQERVKALQLKKLTSHPGYPHAGIVFDPVMDGVIKKCVHGKIPAEGIFPGCTEFIILDNHIFRRFPSRPVKRLLGSGLFTESTDFNNVIP